MPRLAAALLALVALCALQPPAAAQPDPCICTREFFPVCAEGRTFGNGCVATCNGFTNATWVEGECGNCICTLEFAPVCAKGKTFSNACSARCNGYLKFTPRACPEASPKPCVCTKIYKPVCYEGKTYSNSCVAKCAGVTTSVDGKCGEGAKCRCTKIYAPVCAKGKTFSNKCTARCHGYLKVAKGACAPPPIKCDPGSPLAKCAGTICDDSTSPCAKNPAVACLINPCGSATYLGTMLKGRTCDPIYVDTAKLKVVTACDKRKPPPPIKCDPGSPLAKCAGAICDDSMSPCAKNPAVACLINPCGSATYLGTKLKGRTCDPIYVDTAKLKVVAACDKPLPPLVCAPGSPTAKCKGDPCEVTTSPCKGNSKYVCLGNSCGTLTYLGTTLTGAMCTAIFVDPLTRTVAKQCIVK